MTKLSDKEVLLEKKAVELSKVMKDISIAMHHGADTSALQAKRMQLKSEVEQLRKECGYKSRTDFERD